MNNTHSAKDKQQHKTYNKHHQTKHTSKVANTTTHVKQIQKTNARNHNTNAK